MISPLPTGDRDALLSAHPTPDPNKPLDRCLAGPRGPGPKHPARPHATFRSAPAPNHALARAGRPVSSARHFHTKTPPPRATATPHMRAACLALSSLLPSLPRLVVVAPGRYRLSSFPLIRSALPACCTLPGPRRSCFASSVVLVVAW